MGTRQPKPSNIHATPTYHHVIHGGPSPVKSNWWANNFPSSNMSSPFYNQNPDPNPGISTNPFCIAYTEIGTCPNPTPNSSDQNSSGLFKLETPFPWVEVLRGRSPMSSQPQPQTWKNSCRVSTIGLNKNCITQTPRFGGSIWWL